MLAVPETDSDQFIRWIHEILELADFRGSRRWARYPVAPLCRCEEPLTTHSWPSIAPPPAAPGALPSKESIRRRYDTCDVLRAGTGM